MGNAVYGPFAFLSFACSGGSELGLVGIFPLFLGSWDA